MPLTWLDGWAAWLILRCRRRPVGIISNKSPYVWVLVSHLVCLLGVVDNSSLGVAWKRSRNDNLDIWRTTYQWPPRQGSGSSRPSSWGKTPWTRHCSPWRWGTCRGGWARHCKCPSALSPPEKSTFWILQLFRAEILTIKIRTPEIFQKLPSSGIFHQTSPFPCTP